jgi:hypothetical protein
MLRPLRYNYENISGPCPNLHWHVIIPEVRNETRSTEWYEPPKLPVEPFRCLHERRMSDGQERGTARPLGSDGHMVPRLSA